MSASSSTCKLPLPSGFTLCLLICLIRCPLPSAIPSAFYHLLLLSAAFTTCLYHLPLPLGNEQLLTSQTPVLLLPAPVMLCLTNQTMLHIISTPQPSTPAATDALCHVGSLQKHCNGLYDQRPCCHLSWATVQITMSGISTLTSGQAQWRELHAQGYNPLLLASQVGSIAVQAYQICNLLHCCSLSAYVNCIGEPPFLLVRLFALHMRSHHTRSHE